MATVIRLVVVYVFIVAALRIMGKREFSDLTPLELVTLLLVPELVSPAILGEDFSITNALIALVALFSVVFISSLLQFHFKPLQRLINGSPTVLVHEGQMYFQNMDLERISQDEIYSEIRSVGLTRLDQVEWVILESEGRMSVIPRRHQPASE